MSENHALATLLVTFSTIPPAVIFNEWQQNDGSLERTAAALRRLTAEASASKVTWKLDTPSGTSAEFVFDPEDYCSKTDLLCQIKRELGDAAGFPNPQEFRVTVSVPFYELDFNVLTMNFAQYKGGPDQLQVAPPDGAHILLTPRTRNFAFQIYVKYVVKDG